MKKPISPLDRYKEEDLKKSLQLALIGNLVLGLILLFPDIGGWATNYNAQLCVVTAGFFFLFVKYYDWNSNGVNILIALIYLALFYFEYKFLGFPGTDIYYDTNNYQIGKGVLMDLFLWILPGVYIGLRFCLGIPFLLMVKWKK